MHHLQVLPSLIFNDCLKVNIGGPTEPQPVPKFLLQFSVRELHNILVIDPVGGGLKEAVDAENNIIISDSILSSLFSPHF